MNNSRAGWQPFHKFSALCQLDVVHVLIVDRLQRADTLQLGYRLIGADAGGDVARVNATYLYESSFRLPRSGSYILEVLPNGEQVPVCCHLPFRGQPKQSARTGAGGRTGCV